MTVKTDVSRFHIHDELTAPKGSDRLLKGIASTGGAVSKLVGVLAGSPAALRGYLRMRSELRSGTLGEGTAVRIALAVAERRGDGYSVTQHSRRARALGLGLDEISRARSFDSGDEREAALLALLEASLDAEGHPPLHLIEEARELDWTDEQLIEAIAQLALHEYESLLANAAGLPMEGDPSVLAEAA